MTASTDKIPVTHLLPTLKSTYSISLWGRWETGRTPFVFLWPRVNREQIIQSQHLPPTVNGWLLIFGRWLFMNWWLLYSLFMRKTGSFSPQKQERGIMANEYNKTGISVVFGLNRRLEIQTVQVFYGDVLELIIRIIDQNTNSWLIKYKWLVHLGVNHKSIVGIMSAFSYIADVRLPSQLLIRGVHVIR